MPVNRHESETKYPNSVYAHFAATTIGRAFRSDAVRKATLPAYVELIKQIGDQMGVMFRYLEDAGRADITMTVVASYHGDYMGDHWLSDKDLFHEPSVKVPLIVHDSPPEAEATREGINDELVEGIDIATTFIGFPGGLVPDETVERRSLMPLVRGRRVDYWRECAISEYDYSTTGTVNRLNVSPQDVHLFMVATKRWKFMHAEGSFPPRLCELRNELRDVGRDPTYAEAVDECY